jgi:protein-disulfide isomerase
VTENTPKQDTASDEVFRVSRDVINTVVVGIVFMVAGVFIGLLIAGQGLTAPQVRDIVNDEFARGIENELGDTLVAALSAVQAESDLTASDVRSIVREELSSVEVSGGLTADEVRSIVSEEVGAGGSSNTNAADIEAIVQNALDANERQRTFLTDDDPYLGPEDAPVVIVEFSDFLCGFCGRHYEQTLEPLMENFDGYVRYVYRDFPGVGGQNAVQSALASECAADQDAFWPYHGLLFDNQSDLGVGDLGTLRTSLIGYAEELELDIDEFTTCLDEEQHIADIIGDSGDAQSVGARGTPGFLINGRFVAGAQPYDVFEQLILSELQNAGIEYTPPQQG